MSVQKLGDLFDDELSIIISFLKVPEEINFLIMSLKSKRIYNILIGDSIWEQFIKSKIQFLFEKYKLTIPFFSENYRDSFLQYYKQINDIAMDNMKKRELFVNNFKLNLPEKQVPFIELHELDKIKVKKLYTAFKVVIIGNGAVGKTSFIYRLFRDSFDEYFFQYGFDNPCYYFKDRVTTANLWDTAGQDEYDRLRPLSYPDTDLFIICYSIDTVDSFKNVLNKWVLEIHNYTENPNYILVGCKTDLRNDKYTLQTCFYKNKEKLLSEDEGIKLAKKIKAVTYLECSSKTGDGFVILRDRFEKLLTTVLTEPYTNEKKSCEIM
ncbi:hypothetical protein ABK040_002341 [Willaertia magna]